MKPRRDSPGNRITSSRFLSEFLDHNLMSILYTTHPIQSNPFWKIASIYRFYFDIFFYIPIYKYNTQVFTVKNPFNEIIFTSI